MAAIQNGRLTAVLQPSLTRHSAYRVVLLNVPNRLLEFADSIAYALRTLLCTLATSLRSQYFCSCSVVLVAVLDPEHLIATTKSHQNKTRLTTALNARLHNTQQGMPKAECNVLTFTMCR